MKFLMKWIESPTSGYTLRWIFMPMELLLAATWIGKEYTSAGLLGGGLFGVCVNGALALWLWRLFTNGANEAVSRRATLKLTKPELYKELYETPSSS